jgi:putrescine transport system substrate-binding protein
VRDALIAAALGAAAAVQATAHEVVRVYGWPDYFDPATFERFERETGIAVEYDSFDSSEEMHARIILGDAGYDVVVPTSSFLRREIAAEVFAPLDRARIPNLAALDAELMADAATLDPSNAHAAIYLWGTNGIGYNVAMVRERLGADAPTDSWALVFEPETVARLADCGVSMLDSPSEIVPLVLTYLGLPPDSTEERHLDQAAELLAQVMPFVQEFDSAEYSYRLAAGEICVAIGWSGDVLFARDEGAKAGHEIAYVIPREGSMLWFDMLAIPADAPNPAAAHAFIDFVLRPTEIAASTTFTYFPNAVPAAERLVDPGVRDDPVYYPDAEVRARLFPQPVHDARTARRLTRLWTGLRAQP